MLRTNYNDGGATPTTSNVTASDMNGISTQVNTNTNDIGRRWIDITDYGAVGDGTTNNHTAIQNALNAAGCVPVYVPVGNFAIGSSLTMNPGQVFIGANAVGSAFLSGTGPANEANLSTISALPSMNAPLISGPLGVGYVLIRDIYIDGNKANNTSTVGISLPDNSSGGEEAQWILDRVNVWNCGSHGIYIGNGRRACKGYRVVSVYNVGDGLHLLGSDSGWSACSFSTNTGNGIYVSAATTRITGCDIWSNQTGIYHFAGGGVLMYGNGIDHQNGDGIYINVGNGTGTAIIGNYFHSNSQTTNGANHHINVQTGATTPPQNLVIAGNVFGDDGTTNNPAYCVYLYTGTTAYVTGNTLSSATANNGLTNAPNQILHGDTTRVTSITSSATPTFDVDTTDQVSITALAANITSMTSGLSGTPIDGQKLLVRIKDNGTARPITWGTSFVSSGVATLLATTVASKTHMVGLIYDSVAAKWVCAAVDATGY